MTAMDPKSTTKSVIMLTPVSTSTAIDSENDGVVVDTLGFEYLTVYINVGVMATSATLDCKVQSGTAATGTWADITGASWTQLTQAGGDGSEMLVGQVKCFENNRYIQVVATAAAAATVLGAVGVLSVAKDTTEYLTAAEFVFDV